MASPKGIAPLLPDTLPDDFTEWDEGEALPATSHGGSDQGKVPSAHQESRVPLQPAAEREAFLSAVLEKARKSRPVAAEPVLARPPEDAE